MVWSDYVLAMQQLLYPQKAFRTQRLCTAEPIGGKPLGTLKSCQDPQVRVRVRGKGGGLTPTLKPGRERERERERGRETERETERKTE